MSVHAEVMMCATIRWCWLGFLALSPLAALHADDVSSDTVAHKWYQLARYLEADQQYGEASKAISQALHFSPRSLPMLLTAARIHERRDAWIDAVEAYEKLATVDRRLRSEHLKKIAQIEARLGRRDKALAAGREVLAAAPGNPDAFELFAQLCFQFGANDEGLSALRRAVRMNPSDSRTLLLLANALAEQFRTAEAIELLWQAFEKSRDLDGRLSIVQRLTELTAQVNQFEKMIERLQRLRRESKEPRELTICLAQAHQQSGDETTAREELESLWSQETHDTQLLQQLVKLCESAADWEDAVKYQRQFNQVAPSRDGDLRLARFLSQLGNADAASELFLKLTTDETDPERLLKSLDALLQQNRPADVLQVTTRLLAGDVRYVSRWELLYRQGVALALLQQKEAADSFENILKLNLSDDEPDAATKARHQRVANNQPVRGMVASATSATTGAAALGRSPFQQRVFAVGYARMAIQMSDPRVRSTRSPSASMPADYGQCRAAAEAWLVALAQRENREDRYVTDRRIVWEQRRSEPRVALDWYYLQLARMNGLGIFEAAKALSELPDAPIETKWAYLSAITQRSSEPRATGTLGGTTVIMQAQAKTPATPLTTAEFDHMLDCIADVQRLSDDATFLQQGWNPMGLLNELRRAGRDVQAKQVYASLLHDATTPARAIGLMQEARQVGEVEPIQKLVRAIFPEEQSGAPPNRTPTGIPSYYTTRDYHASLLMAVMSAQIRNNQLEQQVQVFESFLGSTLRMPRPKVIPVNAGTTTFAANSQAASLAARQRTYTVYQGDNTQAANTTEQWTFPVPGEHYDRPLLQLLAQMFANHRSANKIEELCEAFRQRADSAERSDRLYWQLGLSHLEWQRGRQQVALREMEQAITLAPDSVSLQVELAGRYEQANEHTKALEILDSLLSRRDTLLDHDSRRDAELMVLRLAMRMELKLEYNDRAKLAAERLFSMNLDANMLLEVSQRMEKLGLTDHADAMRNRTRNKAGNQNELLLTLMRDYQAKTQTELATEVAHQILRRTPRPTIQQRTVRTSSGTTSVRILNAPPAQRGVPSASNLRQEALTVLRQAGRLAEMITKTEDQLSKSPNSTRHLETLAEYLQAAGQTARDPDIARRIAELKQVTSNSFVQTTQTIDDVAALRTRMQRGDLAGAASGLETWLKRSPEGVALRWKEIDAVFQSNPAREELARIIERVERPTLERAWMIAGTVSSELIRSSTTRERGIRLLIKALDASPANLSGLLVLSGVSREVVEHPQIAAHIRTAVIPSTSRPLNDYWQGTRLLATTQKSNHPLTAFATILLDSCDEPGKLADLERSIDEALKSSITWPGGRVLKGLILLRRGKHREAEQTLNAVLEEFKATMPAETREVIAREVEDVAVLNPLALRAYESLANSTPWPLDPSTGPVQRLIRLYSASGQREKARDLLLRNASQPSSVLNTNAIADREVTRLTEISKQLRSLNFNVEAARVCRDTLANREFFRALPTSSAKQLRERLDDSLRRAVMKFDAGHLVQFLVGDTLADAPEATPSGMTPTITDWALFLEPVSSNETRLRSVLLNVLEQTAQDSVAASLTLRSRLSQLRKRQPQDSSLTMLSLLVRIAEKSDPSLSEESLPDLRQLRQQIATEPPAHIALWLIARECLRASESKTLAEPVRHELRELGEALGEHAAEAARIAERDPQVQSLAVVIYFEWAQLEFNNSDADTIEKRWRRMLHAIRPNVAGAEEANAPTTPAQFEHSARFATQAAEHGHLTLSMRAISKPLENGPPMEAFEWKQFQAGDELRTGFGPSPRDDARFCTVSKSVAEEIVRQESAWRKLGLSDQQLYDWLLPIVLPTSRHPEVLLYARPIPIHSADGPSGLGATLVKMAVATGKTDALRERLETHLTKPRGEFAARVLLTHLAVLQNDAAQAEQQLTRLQEMLQTTTRRSSVEAAIQALAAARRLEQPPPVVKSLLSELIAKSKAAGF